MNALAWLVVRLRFLILPAWIVAAVLATTHLPSFIDRGSSDIAGLVPTHSRATATEKLGIAAFGTPLISRVEVVQHDPNGLSRDVQLRALQRARRIDESQDPVLHSIAFALPVSNEGRIVPSSRESGTTIVTYLYFRPSVGQGAQLALAHTFAQRIEQRGDPVTGVTGTVAAHEAEFREIQKAMPVVEAATVWLIARILLVVFRGFGAPLFTLGAAALSYLISPRVLTWTADRQGVAVPNEIEPVLVALLLGLTTDYAVFFLSGVRRGLVEGQERLEATERTTRSVLPIVVTAGLIVAVGTGSLVIGQLGFFRAFGPGMAVTVLITLAIAITAVPAALALFGRALFWPGLRSAKPREPSPLRLKAGRFLTRTPVAIVLAVVASAVLIGAATLTRSTALGVTILRGLPPSNEVRRAADDASAGFAPGIVAPTEILLQGSSLGAEREQLTKLQAMIAGEPGVAGVVGAGNQPEQVKQPVFINQEGPAARFGVILGEEPLSAPAIDHLRALEDRLPSLLERAGLSGVRAGIAGDTAIADETVRTIHSDIARVALALLLANLVLLVIFLRALVAPLYLLAASVLALAASLGVTTWLFQTVLGHQDLTYYVPFAAAVLLLSLGSDYNIFISGRIWQEARRRPFREAIRYASPRASGTISIAAITLAGSFALLALIPIRPMRELAFVMAAGILIDSFIVRSILVPSLAASFGSLSWWPNRPPRPEGVGRAEPAPAGAAPSARSGTRGSGPA
jgi:RND superfamily putative drug exporter